MNSNRQDEANIYFRCFNTEDGKYVLNKLKEVFINRAIARSGDGLLEIGIRQGEANIVKKIEQQIKIAKGE